MAANGFDINSGIQRLEPLFIYFKASLEEISVGTRNYHSDVYELLTFDPGYNSEYCVVIWIVIGHESLPPKKRAAL